MDGVALKFSYSITFDVPIGLMMVVRIRGKILMIGCRVNTFHTNFLDELERVKTGRRIKHV